MSSDTMPLRHFVFGKFIKPDVSEYHILAYDPPTDFPLLNSARDSVDRITTFIAMSKTGDVRLLLPSNVGFLYIRQFPSSPTDSANRPVPRAHVVLLDEMQLSELAWRPWQLDPWLASGIGESRLMGPDGIDGQVVAGRKEGVLPIAVPREKILPSIPVGNIDRAYVQSGAGCLQQGWS